MAPSRKPGPECISTSLWWPFDTGTLCRQQTPIPGPIDHKSPPTPVQEACKRTVIYSSDGVGFYAFYEGRGGGVIGQSPNVKASPDFIKCATDFERKWSFLVYKDRWPVVLEYAPNYIDHVAGEVVGHYMTINRYEISAETATLSRLPPPYNQPFNNSPIEALFNGYAETGLNHENFVQLGFKVPLYVGKADEAGYSRLAPSDEGAPSYTVVTDIYGQIVLLVSGQSSRYPKSETTLHVIVKTTIKKTAIKGIKIIVKNLWRLIF